MASPDEQRLLELARRARYLERTIGENMLKALWHIEAASLRAIVGKKDGR